MINLLSKGGFETCSSAWGALSCWLNRSVSSLGNRGSIFIIRLFSIQTVYSNNIVIVNETTV